MRKIFATNLTVGGNKKCESTLLIEIDNVVRGAGPQGGRLSLLAQPPSFQPPAFQPPAFLPPAIPPNAFWPRASEPPASEPPAFRPPAPQPHALLLRNPAAAVLPPLQLQAALVDPAQAAMRDAPAKRNRAAQSGAALAAASRDVLAAQERAQKALKVADAAARSSFPAFRAQHPHLHEQAESFTEQLVRSVVQLKQCAKRATAAVASLEQSADTLDVASRVPTLREQDRQNLVEAARGAKLQATQLAASATEASAHALWLLPDTSRQNPVDVG